MGYIRLLLAISVYQGHAWAIFPPKVYELSGGVVSVRMFYIISGFLMAMVLSDKYDSPIKFYKSRLLRLIPVYYCVLFLSILISVISYIKTGDSFLLGYFSGYRDTVGIIGCAILAIPQLSTIGLDVFGFIGIDTTGIIFITETWKHVNGYQFLIVPQAWTLGIECWFYLLAPWIISRRKVIFFLLALSIIIKLVIENNLSYSSDDPWVRRFFPTELQFFLFGVISFKFKKYLKSNNTKHQLGNLALILLIIIFMGMPPIANINPTILYLLFALSLPNILNISKLLPLDRMIGDFSYPFYLIHWLMLHIVFNSYLPHFNWPKAITFVYSIIISYILIIVVEKRVNVIRTRFASHFQKVS